MRKIRSFRCRTCGKTYFNHREWLECYGCSYDRNVKGIVTKPLPPVKG